MLNGVLTEIIGLLTGGITGIASGIGQGLTTLVKSVMLTGTGTEQDPYKLSIFGGMVAVFGGISLAIGLSRLIVKWVTSLGASRV